MILKHCKSQQSPSNVIPRVIIQDNVSEEASQITAKTNGKSSVLTQVDDSEEASQTATITNKEVGVQAVPEGAATKVPAAHPKANPSQRKSPPPGSVLSPDLSCTNTKASVEKNLGLALNGQRYTNAEFVKASSPDVSTSFTQLMTKVYIVSKIIQSEPMPNFRKKLPTESPTKKKKKKEKEKKRSLLQQVRDEREVGDTKAHLYGDNVMNYVTIKKATLGAKLGYRRGVGLGVALEAALESEPSETRGTELGAALQEAEDGAAHGAALGAALGARATCGTALGWALSVSLGETLGATLGAALGETLGAARGAGLVATLRAALGVALCAALGGTLGTTLDAG
eukprot:jgi/Psemu1/24045/gm1.24045_g